MAVPPEFLKPAGSPRDPAEGAPATVFRYDLMWEFISAIVEGRPAVPSFHDGLNAQRRGRRRARVARPADLDRHAPGTDLSGCGRAADRGSVRVGRDDLAAVDGPECPPDRPAHRALDEADAAVAQRGR